MDEITLAIAIALATLGGDEKKPSPNVPVPRIDPAPAKTCPCSPQCTCGCNAGKECECNKIPIRNVPANSPEFPDSSIRPQSFVPTILSAPAANC